MKKTYPSEQLYSPWVSQNFSQVPLPLKIISSSTPTDIVVSSNFVSYYTYNHKYLFGYNLCKQNTGHTIGRTEISTKRIGENLMPLQNRVAPTGEIVKSSDRGTLMGNRGGAMHNAHKELVSVSKTTRWITCRLEFKGRKRELMSEGLYTELFFLDEATAFAAGHRPCAECRRARFNEFKKKWLEVNSDLLDGNYTGIAEIDKIMHKQRIDKNKEKVAFEAPCNTLPDGTMISMGEDSYLIWKDKLYLWSFAGYKLSDAVISNGTVTVLTPKSYVEIFRHGFEPVVHGSLEET